MSIWAPWATVGYEEPRPGRPRSRCPAVLSYAEGWSNHYPDRSGEVEREASVDLAYIPDYCVSGREEAGRVGAWLRLSATSPLALSWWPRDSRSRPAPEPQFAALVLDERAVRALRDELDAWLARPKVGPKRGAR